MSKRPRGIKNGDWPKQTSYIAFNKPLNYEQNPMRTVKLGTKLLLKKLLAWNENSKNIIVTHSRVLSYGCSYLPNHRLTFTGENAGGNCP